MKRSIVFTRTLWIVILVLVACSPGASQLDWYYYMWGYSVIAPGYSPRVLKLEPAGWAGGYHCWYAIATTGGWDIYHAISTDGNAWSTKGVALRRGTTGDFDAVWAVDPCVVVRDSQLVMYYNGYDGMKYQTGVAFSRDGVQWTKYEGNPVLRAGTGWDSIVAVAREVIENLHGSAYRFTMYYVGYEGAAWRTGVAFSDDGLTWTRYDHNPVLDVGPPGSWDVFGVSTNAIVMDGGLYYMFYQTRKPSSLGVATSSDGLTWTKYRRNPILQPPYFATSLGFGSMLLEDGFLRYWFSLEDFSWGIYYAISPWKPDIITGIADAAPSLRTILLHEAYPNPCNPSTTIRYELPDSRDVRLAVYDMIGREVSVLVDQKKEAGIYDVRFDGSGLASGVYLARLTAGNFVQARKVLIVR